MVNDPRHLHPNAAPAFALHDVTAIEAEARRMRGELIREMAVWLTARVKRRLVRFSQRTA